MSATAASASLNTFEPPRSIFGASENLAAVVEYEAFGRVVGTGDRSLEQRIPRWTWGRPRRSALRDNAAPVTRKVAMLYLSCSLRDEEGITM